MVIGLAWRLAIFGMLSPTRCSFPVHAYTCTPLHPHPSFSVRKSVVIFSRLIIGIAFICTWNIGYAWADSLESALMPGQVIQGHAQWEEDCAKCHKRFDKAAQTRLARIATNHAGSLQCCKVAARDGQGYL